MIDELDLFHGSNDDFSEFDAAYIKTSIYGCGFNFTTDIELASDYGNKIYTIEIPDSSKLFPMDYPSDEEKNMLFDEFVETINSEDIDITEELDFKINKLHEKLSSEPKFYTVFWEMSTLLSSVLNADGNIVMSDILAKMGYIGTKKDIEDNNLIVVLFDRNSFKVKKIEKISESLRLIDSFKRVIREVNKHRLKR